MPASYSELLLVMALKWAICGAKNTCCTQKIFHYKSVINFCGFPIKNENLFVLHFLGRNHFNYSQHNPHKNSNHHELLQKLKEFIRCKNFKIWYIKNLKKKNIFFIQRFCLRYSQYISTSLATIAFISRYRISRFNALHWGEGSAKPGIFLQESSRWKFSAWKMSSYHNYLKVLQHLHKLTDGIRNRWTIGYFTDI